VRLIKTLRQVRNQFHENQGINPPHVHRLKARSAFDRSLFKMQRMGRALALGLSLVLLPSVATFAQQQEDPEAATVCIEIQIFDLNGVSGTTLYRSSPNSTDPNTINICTGAEFEITDDPYAPEGRCHVPLAEVPNQQWYVLYLISANLTAALPTSGTVVPQSTGDWNVVLNAGNIPAYNQSNFPPPLAPGVYNSFTASTPGTYAIIGVICELDGNNNYRIISTNIGNSSSPVSNKIFLNLLDPAQPLVIDGDQHLCEGASDIYSLPTSLAGFNPIWTVTGGTFTGTGTNIQVNWTVPFTGTRSVNVHIQIGEGQCEQEVTLEVFDCCTSDEARVYIGYNTLISESPFANMGSINPSNTGVDYIVVNGFLHIDQNIEIDGIALFMGPYTRITVADGIHFEVKNLQISAICNVMYDGIYASNPTQSISFDAVGVIDAINGLVSERGGLLHVVNSSFGMNRVGITIRDYNPTLVSSYNGNISPIQIYGSSFVGMFYNGFNIVGFPYPPFQNVTNGHIAIKIENSGFVAIGVRNQSPNSFNNQTSNGVRRMERAILMTNSGGNIVNNHFEGINIIGSPSQAGAIMASTSSHQSWIAPLQIGKLWTGGAAGDANHFENGYLAIQTTNVRSVFVQENTFKDNSSNIVLINASNQRVVQFNKINHQLGSTATPNRSAVGISIASTQGVPTSGGIVSNNHVEACFQGIMLTTVNSMTVTYNDIRTFTAQGASQTSIRAGISAVNGWNLNIYRNNMQHNNLPLNSDVSGNNLRGINLNNVVDAYVWDNYVLRYGAGIFAENDNRVSQFRCNFLVNSIWGFNFANVYLDQQGNPGDPTDNQWVGNRRAIRTNGTNDINMPSRDWFYRSGFEFNPNALAPTLYTIIPVLTSAGEVECSNVVLPNDTNPKDDKYEDPEIVEDVFGAVVDSSLQFSSASVQYFEESMTYRILDQNPAIIQQTTTHQQAFDDFYTAQHTGSKGDVKRLYDALLGESTSDYEQMLSTFQPSNTFENKIAEVSAIYAQSWAKGRFELDSAERSVLLPIAQADASLWGEAVYTARVMLGMFDLDGNIGAGNQRRALNEVVLPEQELGKPYPNPTTGAFALVGSIETGLEQANIRLLDLQGRVVSNAVALYNDGAWQVADLSLPAGMYMYEFSIDAKIMQRGKIVIK